MNDTFFENLHRNHLEHLNSFLALEGPGKSQKVKPFEIKVRQDQGDQGRSPGFTFWFDLDFKDIFRFCEISVLVTFQFW